MVLTAFVLLLLPAFLFRTLRRLTFILHITAVITTAWVFDQFIVPDVMPFSARAWQTVLLFHLVSINLLTFFLYVYDRLASGQSLSPPQNRVSVSENTLHILMFLGGTLGAMLGQYFFIKRRKPVSFRVIFWLIFAVQVSALTLYGIW